MICSKNGCFLFFAVVPARTCLAGQRSCFVLFLYSYSSFGANSVLPSFPEPTDTFGLTAAPSQGATHTWRLGTKSPGRGAPLTCCAFWVGRERKWISAEGCGSSAAHRPWYFVLVPSHAAGLVKCRFPANWHGLHRLGFERCLMTFVFCAQFLTHTVFKSVLFVSAW